LYIYVNAAKVAENAALEQFVEFYLSDDGFGVIGTGDGQVPYVPMAADTVTAVRTVWDTREIGSRDGGK
ncbi:MAG: hypothetical protein RL119_1029, partial [Actinomycetota bacterium]